MNKIKNLLKHRQIEKIGLTEYGGLTIKFDDNSHTYISPDMLSEIFYAYEEMKDEFKEEE